MARPMPPVPPVTMATFVIGPRPPRSVSQELEVSTDLPIRHAGAEPLELPPSRGREDANELGPEVLLRRVARLERVHGRLERHRDRLDGGVAGRVALMWLWRLDLVVDPVQHPGQHAGHH